MSSESLLCAAMSEPVGSSETAGALCSEQSATHFAGWAGAAVLESWCVEARAAVGATPLGSGPSLAGFTESAFALCAQGSQVL